MMPQTSAVFLGGPLPEQQQQYFPWRAAAVAADTAAVAADKADQTTQTCSSFVTRKEKPTQTDEHFFNCPLTMNPSVVKKYEWLTQAEIEHKFPRALASVMLKTSTRSEVTSVDLGNGISYDCFLTLYHVQTGVGS